MATIDITKFAGPNSLSARMQSEIYAPKVNSINRVDLNCSSVFQNFVFWVRNDSSLIATGTKLILTVATVASCIVYVGIVILKKTATEIGRQRVEEITIKNRITQHIVQQSNLLFVFQNILNSYEGKKKIPLITRTRVQYPLFKQGDPPIKIIELKNENDLPTYLIAMRTINKNDSKELAEYTFAPHGENFQMNMHCEDNGIIRPDSQEWDELELQTNLLSMINGNEDAILYT